jgi:hypothetical protein
MRATLITRVAALFVFAGFAEAIYLAQGGQR